VTSNRVFLNTNPKWPVIVAFLNSSGLVWTGLYALISGINQKVHDPSIKRAKGGKFAFFARCNSFPPSQLKFICSNKSIYEYASNKCVRNIFLVSLEENDLSYFYLRYGLIETNINCSSIQSIRTGLRYL